MSLRLGKLRARMAQLGLEAALVSQAENRRYLSGFTGSAGYLLISQEQAILATDFRYLEQAPLQAPDFQVIKIEGEIKKWLPSLVQKLGASKISFEAADVSVALHRQLVSALAEAEKKASIQLVPVENLVEPVRAIKDEGEIGHIERAVALADAAISHILSEIKPGMTEKQIAWELEKFLKENSSEPLPFDLLVASGPNGAMPHLRPTDRVPQPGEPIVIDIGARIAGYCSDLTRTICLGKPDKTLAKIYDIVLGAQLTAEAIVGSGMNGEQADQLARTVISQAGYGEAFGHGLGHGVGLAPHEFPRLGHSSQDVLADGMVVTIEPGIYISGWGGVRIEDMIILEHGKARVLSQAKKTGLGSES